jgi:RNA polymerase sigma-70 factor (ECF subfamily)
MENGGPDVSETVQLLQRWHAGDRDALGALLRRDLPWIESHVRSRLGAPLRAKVETGDILQEAVVEFLQYGPRFLLADRGHFRALLARIVENTIRAQHDRFTAQRRAMHREEPLPADGIVQLDPGAAGPLRPSQAAEAAEWKGLVRLALELLAPGEREVLLLRDWDDLSFEEIGRRLGIAADAARMRYHRSLARLAGKVEQARGGKVAQLLEDAPDGD